MLPCKIFTMLHNKGFTLIELIMVMLIVSLASSMVFVAVSSGVFASSDRKFAREFVSLLSRAKAASLGRRRIVAFLIDGENRKFCIEGGKWHDIPTTIQVSADGLTEKNKGVYSVVFYPDGSSSGGEIDLEYDETGNRMSIHISKLVGIIDVESTNE